MAAGVVAHIIDYTVFGDYFWTGKGFGISLADDDGFQGTAWQGRCVVLTTGI